MAHLGQLGLVIALALAAAAFAAFQAVDSGGGGQSVQLREDVRGGVDDAVNELRGLIEDNTGN